MANDFCTTDPGALTAKHSSDQRIDRCVGCGHTHWCSEMGGMGTQDFYCDACYDAEMVLAAAS